MRPLGVAKRLEYPRHQTIEKENTRINHRFHYFSNNLSMIVLSYTIDIDIVYCLI